MAACLTDDAQHLWSDVLPSRESCNPTKPPYCTKGCWYPGDVATYPDNQDPVGLCMVQSHGGTTHLLTARTPAVMAALSSGLGTWLGNQPSGSRNWLPVGVD